MVKLSFEKEFKGKTYTINVLKDGSLSIKDSDNLVAKLSVEEGLIWTDKIDPLLMEYIIETISFALDSVGF
ncbi:MAG: hypothetical protein KAR35_06700 [Candidatus Heimdallarchaeota archaeon]|nr:hypothetical protein [Candidatus Heimdallarchaeota archaeon]MCK5049048.1 hypothetical protein [Candidatus Heimdallarchaeota archaeon]